MTDAQAVQIIDFMNTWYAQVAVGVISMFLAVISYFGIAYILSIAKRAVVPVPERTRYRKRFHRKRG